MADSGIITMEEYGNVRLKLKERMDSDGINRNTLARRIGVRFEVVDKWYRGDVEKLDLDILARICCVLHCTVGDLATCKIYREKNLNGSTCDIFLCSNGRKE